MKFRTRLLLTTLAVVMIPLVSLGHLLRREIARSLETQYAGRVAAVSAILDQEVRSETDRLRSRLESLSEALSADNRFRRAVVQETPDDRLFLIDYALGKMQLAALDVLQIQNDSGRVISSGHFRNEFGRMQPRLVRELYGMRDSVALVETESASGSIVALTRAQPLRVGRHTLHIVGGVSIEPIVAALGGDPDISVGLFLPGPGFPFRERSALRTTIPLPIIGTDGIPTGTATILIEHSDAPLRSLRAQIDRSIILAVSLTAAIAILVTLWIARFISRPLNMLATQTARLDLDKLEVDFATNRRDEIGTLSRLLRELVDRLRLSAQRVRDVERRVAVGDLARQVNHDIKNGLTPLRNVFRHLSEVAEASPDELPGIFSERRSTVESSLEYLGDLASNYARLTPDLQHATCDLNAVVLDVASEATGSLSQTLIETILSASQPAVNSDRVALRRIIENLVRNAIDAIDGRPGTVTIETGLVGDGAGLVRLQVSDTGSGMTEAELERAFEDFFTTRSSGTGLGLSVVRRLVLDLRGALRVQTEPGTGTRVIIDLPSANATGEEAQ